MEDSMATARRPGTIGEAELSAATGGVNGYLKGGDGADILLGTGGSELLDSGGGADSINAGAGDDDAVGGAGADTIFGGAGNDFLAGREDDDSLVGGHGNDVMFGDDGADTLVGAAGVDQMHGGRGDDVYIWSKGDGSDEIRDHTGVDTLQLLDTGLTKEQFQAALWFSGGGIENFADRFSADGRSVNVEGLSGHITINGETIRFSGIDKIELVDVQTRSVASATG
jgi:Ca2+-binding RTX toxin-like protein